jgi:probable O-glycosylation ligase (exosortase A-associated)
VFMPPNRVELKGSVRVAVRLAPLPRRSYVRPINRAGPPTTSPLKGVQWTVTVAGFLLYLLVITSYRLPLGEVAIAAALGGLLLQRGGVRFPLCLAWLTAFALWALVGALLTDYPELVRLQLLEIVKLCLIVLVAANAMQTRAQMRLFMVFFLGCFALWPLRGAMFNFFLYHSDMDGRAIWNQLYGNPNDLGAIALLQLSMAVMLLESEPKGWVRWCAVLGIILIPMLILMTQSRGVFLGLLVFIAIALVGQRRRLRLLFRIGVVALLLAAVVPAGVWDRFGSLRHATSTTTLDEVDGAEGSARQRYEIWRVGWKIARDHPLTGVGLGAYKPNHEQYALRPEFNPTAQGGRDTHSLYLNVLAETGYPGFLLYLGMLLTVFITAERTRRLCRGVLDTAARQILVLEAGLVAFLAAAVFGSLPYLPHFLLHLVLLYAMSIWYRNQLRAATATPPTRRRKLRRTARGVAALAAARLRKTASVWATLPPTGRT